jgi:hypothetical protein
MNPRAELVILIALGFSIIYTLFVLDIGNENNFATEQDCLNKCGHRKRDDSALKCNLEADSGPCFAYFERYFYNKTSQKCEKFIFGNLSLNILCTF